MALAIMALLGSTLHAQGTRGKEFWTGFMFNVTGNNEPGQMSLYITSRVNTTGVVSVPNGAWSQPFGIAANTGIIITLPSFLVMSFGSEGIEGKGVRIVTLDTVDVVAMNYLPQSVDASPVFSLDALGSDYRILSYQGTTADVFRYPSQFMVIAPRDSTVVEITPSSTTVAGRPPGVPFTVTLQAGENIQVQSHADLTGSRVRTLDGKKIVVVSGSARSKVPAGYSYEDHLFEQMYSTDRWGTSYVTVPLKGPKSDAFRILAGSDNTTVTIDGANPFTLNAGEFREFQLSSASTIVADKPITVGQYCNSSTFDFLTGADPFLMILNPVDFMRQELRFFVFPLTTTEARYYINVVALTSAVNSVRLDGTSVGGSFQPVPADPFYSYAQLEVGRGEHTITAFFGLIGYVCGYGNLEGYGYATGAENLLPCPYPQIAVMGDTVLCEGESTTLDAGPGYVAYMWSNNETTQQITVTQSGTYSVVTIDSNGCQRPSRPVTVKVSPLPPAAIDVSPSATICPCDSATLTGPPGFSYRWSNGSIEQSIVVDKAGDYTLEVTDTSGCRSLASTVTIRIDEIRTLVSIESDSAAPGDLVRIPLVSRTSGGMRCGMRDFTASIRFDRTLLLPMRMEGASVARDSIAGDERIMTIKGSSSADTLAVLEFIAALGGSVQTSVTIDSFRWDACDAIPIDTSGGIFALRDICYEGGPRLLAATGGTVLKGSRPSPASGIVSIDYHLAESGPTDLYLVDLLGRRIATLAGGDLTAGSHTTVVDTRSLPAGVYFYILETRSERMVEMMSVGGR